MKKLLALTLAALLCFGLAAVGTIGASALEEGNFTYVLTNGDTQARITGYVTKPTGALNIPETIGGAPVTTIADSAFKSCTGITSVTIPAGVTYIWYDAFWGCTGLTSVTLPDSLIVIEEAAFWGCSNLKSIVIPSGILDIASNAFNSCHADFTIRGTAGSYAERFAAGKGIRFLDSSKEYFKLWGKETDWEKSTLNWFLMIVCFGWIWMAF